MATNGNEWTEPERQKARYEFVTKQLQYTNDKILDAFKDWVKLVALIVGGYLWLKIEKQNLQADIKADVPALAKMLLAFAGVCYGAMIAFGALSWFRYRKAEHKLMPDSPAPRCCLSVSQEVLMIAAIGVVTALAWHWIY